MPFIRGRYHINPIAGEALEAARQAEETLRVLEQRAREGRPGDDSTGYGCEGHNCQIHQGTGAEDDANPQDEESGGGTASNAGNGPIHRVEIEAAELVPAHTGRAQRGFVARVHRTVVRAGGDPSGGSGRGEVEAGSQAETHAFARPGDLVGFLRDQLAKSGQQGN
ncbi:MAG: hypothetical protein WBS18_12775 [Candidatus Acidiferrales bacterium]